jgi:uroporphyrinogen-III synthase
MNELSLQGRTIAVPETRALDVFASMLERRGAIALRCPLVAIRDAPDPGPVLDWLQHFNAGECDDLILLTGEGLRRLLDAIDRHLPDQRALFLERLGTTRSIVRGPKPGRVLRELGLKPDIVAAAPTTDGVIETLAGLELQGRCVGVQLYGTEANPRLIDAVVAAGARPLPVAPYVYADAADDAEVMAMVRRMAEGGVDAIAFTSMAQVDRLFRVAADHQAEPLLREAMARCSVAAVGPVVADALRERGLRVDVMPGEAFFLKPLTTALAALLATPDAD